MVILKSKYPDIEIPCDVGIYQFVMSNPNQISDDKAVFIDAITHKKIAFGNLKSETRRFAAGLQDHLGFKRGDVLCVYSPNQIDYATVVFGCLAAGGKVSPANCSYTAEELTYQLLDSGATVIIAHPDTISKAIEASINAKIPQSNIFVFGDHEVNGIQPYTSLLGIHEAEPVCFTPEEIKTTTAFLCYSSGTTGRSKGVETTHYNVVANLMQTCAFEGDNVHSSLCYLGVLPFYHMYALSVNLHFTLLLGATTIVIQKFDIKTFFKAIQDYKVDIAPVVPPILLLMVKNPTDCNLKYVMCAAAPLSKSLSDDFDRIYRIPIKQLYGLTETSPITHIGPLEKLVNGSVGVLLPNIQAKIISENGHELGFDQPGELYLRGPMVMKGYLNNQEATDNCIDKDGWFRTGDIAKVDKDAPAELESLLLTHPAIADAAVIGVYSEKEATELPRAYVVPQGQGPTIKLQQEILQYVASRVSYFKRLKGGVVFVDKIPKSLSGKILRRMLRTGKGFNVLTLEESTIKARL
ncbi:14348_t:CDS:10 [Cetraspora pellucida]|uniref:14348_t:CDS:1 n=1 Tax=Cetraspora pellucida TaxID=1433469 RepID=A0ACA9K784_9GLOM|nr:14348_t:CDS:10 [Cetraspora pellucida]